MMDIQKLHDELIAVENEMISADMIDSQARWMSEMKRLRARQQELKDLIAAAEAQIENEGRLMTAPITSFQLEHAFLSNFYPAPVILWDEGRTYPTVEHAYQAAKTFNLLERDVIFRMKTPGAAKRAGKALPSLRRDWDEMKIDVMHGLLDQKFALGSELAAKLKATGDAVLIESNHWGDTFWGVCRSEGQNHLGKLLMSIRATL